MVFNIAKEKMLMIGGSIVTIKAGKFETTDDATIKALSSCFGVSKEQRSKKKSSLAV